MIGIKPASMTNHLMIKIGMAGKQYFCFHMSHCQIQFLRFRHVIQVSLSTYNKVKYKSYFLFFISRWSACQSVIHVKFCLPCRTVSVTGKNRDHLIWILDCQCQTTVYRLLLTGSPFMNTSCWCWAFIFI